MPEAWRFARGNRGALFWIDSRHARLAHSAGETRFLGIGCTMQGRHVFVAFTIRQRDGVSYIRQISARYMHAKEVAAYEKANR